MKKNPKVEVIKLDVGVTCYNCEGEGCNHCSDGRYEENHYIMIVGNMAIDMDTIK